MQLQPSISKHCGAYTTNPQALTLPRLWTQTPSQEQQLTPQSNISPLFCERRVSDLNSSSITSLINYANWQSFKRRKSLTSSQNNHSVSSKVTFLTWKCLSEVFSPVQTHGDVFKRSSTQMGSPLITGYLGIN